MMLKTKIAPKAFSKSQLAAFVLVFACIGGFILLQSRAATSTANIFISPNGSDAGSNCKRFASPIANPDPGGTTLCASFNKAYQLSSCGDTIGVTSGTYSQQNINAASQGCTMNTLIKVTPILGASAVINGLSVSSAGYIDFDSLDLSGSTVSIQAMGANSKCGDAGTAQYITLRNLTAATFELLGPVQNINVLGGSYGPAGNGLHSRVAWNGVAGVSDAPCNVVIDGVTVHNVSVCPTNNLGCDTTGTLIHTECLQLNYSSLAGHPSRNITVQNSKFLKCPSEVNGVTGGVATGSADGIYIRNNFIGGGTNAGLVVTYDARNLVIENNSSPRGVAMSNTYAACSTVPCGPYIIRSNYMVLGYGTCDNHVSPSAGASGVSFTYRYNVWKSDGGGGTALCTGNVNDSLVSSLDFKDPTNDDYHLNGATASAIGKGDPQNCPPNDIDGDSRPQGGTCDAGADEYVPTANVWISTAGNDTTCIRGDQTKPCATADKAASLAQAGDIIQVAGGNYEHFKLTGRCFTDWVTFEPVPGQTAVIDGGSGGTDDFNGAWELAGSGAGNCYIRIQGFEMTDRVFIDLNASHIDINDNYIHSKDSPPDVNSGSANVTVSGVATRCSGGGCVTGQSNITIENNHFKNIAYNCLGTGNDLNACDTADNSPVGYGYCIPTGTTITNLIIKNNWLDGCWEDGIQTALGTGTQTIQDNRFDEIGGGATSHSDGIQIFTAVTLANAVIQRNVWSGAHSTCIRIQDGERDNFTIQNNVCGTSSAGRCMDLEDFHNSTISFNTCGPTQFGFTLEDDPAVPGGPDSDIIENNIFEDASGACSIDISGTNIIYRYNIVTDPCSTGGGALSNCTAGCLTTHPIFINSTNGADLRLAAGSVGIDAGYAEAGVSLDAAGQSRPIDVPAISNSGAGSPPFYDIGAYEFSAGGPQGDLNSDGHVNVTDLSIMLSHFSQSATAVQGDINSDGVCNITDLSILLSHYGT